MPVTKREAAAVAAILAVFAVAGFLSLRDDSATFDETTHLAAGYSYLDRFDFRHNPEHPPLVKMAAALPLKLLGRGDPDYASPSTWTGVRVPPDDPQRSRANQWAFGFAFLNGPPDDPARRDPMALLVPARTAMLLLGALLTLVVWGWTRQMFGGTAALAAAGLTALSPAILAHARLVTTDVPAAFGVTASLWAAWRFFRAAGIRRAAVLGAAIGVALLFKFSTLIVVPLIAGFAVADLVRHRDALRGRLRTVAVGAVVSAAVAWGTIWAGYGFRYAAASDPGYRLEWEGVNTTSGAMARAVALARDARLLPEGYLFGLAYAGTSTAKRLAFLNGELSITGWWFYFPEAFLLKTPPAFLAMAAWAGLAGLLRTRGRSWNGWFVGFPAAAWMAFAMAGNLNIGHRHLVPIYPLLAIVAATLVRPARFAPPRWGTALLLAGCGVSFLAAHPGYLSYFNLAAGGARGGWRYLVDSNIDWGQDLPKLKRWMDANAVDEVALAYFGTADPRAYGIRYKKVVVEYDFRPDEPAVRPASGDLLAVSVTLLQGMYLNRDKFFADEALRRGLITPADIRTYMPMHDARMAAGSFTPFADWLVETGKVSASTRREVEGSLLPAFMDTVRRDWKPIGWAGDSIALYRVP